MEAHKVIWMTPTLNVNPNPPPHKFHQAYFQEPSWRSSLQSQPHYPYLPSGIPCTYFIWMIVQNYPSCNPKVESHDTLNQWNSKNLKSHGLMAPVWTQHKSWLPWARSWLLAPANLLLGSKLRIIAIIGSVSIWSRNNVDSSFHED